ncbi:MAG: type II and III secretion system protein [Phascolarctobacterium sp.]|uniref:type II secretion system protein GspD n=1 Tax=Phascolarctobacterium sp. TaxID=2049039 RepID=UPI0025E036D3|nr:secretin N-terminal domain-containing protein [Phascolarctobacterium sp.]MCC8159427.1 type II and III secretion system protein [Phascolarctobacterium sp.]
MHSWKKSLRNTTLSALLAFSSTAVALAAPNVTLNVHDGEVRDVLTAISALSDASIVTDESVRGRITIALDNVPFNTAIKLITSAKGLAYRVVDGVILVSTQENLNKFNGNVNVFKLNYAKAEDVKTALDSILDGDKKISIDPITNSILFSGSSTDEERVRSAIKAMDVATKQITLEAKIIAINKEDSKNLGINWNWDKIPQNSEDNNNGGGNNDDEEDFGGVVHFGASYEFRFNATLNALFANGKAKILATPRIITVPGKEASIFIGDHIPVLTEKIENGVTVNTTEYVDAGIKLTYTPLVSEDDMITSAVHTEVSTPTLVSEIKNYKITSRTADTYVRMRNGETLIIGGLINEEEQKNIQKIPFLSNIPILGELFKNRSTTKNKTEVMMILTPHITEAGSSPAIYDTQSLENEFRDFDDNTFLKDIKKSERAQAEAKIKAQQKELDKEMQELQKEFSDDKAKSPQTGSMRDRVNQILNENN